MPNKVVVPVGDFVAAVVPGILIISIEVVVVVREGIAKANKWVISLYD